MQGLSITLPFRAGEEKTIVMGFSPVIYLLGKVLATPRSAQVYLSKVGCTRAGLSLASVAGWRLRHANPDRF